MLPYLIATLFIVYGILLKYPNLCLYKKMKMAIKQILDACYMIFILQNTRSFINRVVKKLEKKNK